MMWITNKETMFYKNSFLKFPQEYHGLGFKLGPKSLPLNGTGLATAPALALAPALTPALALALALAHIYPTRRFLSKG